MIGNAFRDEAIGTGMNLIADALKVKVYIIRQNAADVIENIRKQEEEEECNTKEKKQGGKSLKPDFLSDWCKKNHLYHSDKPQSNSGKYRLYDLYNKDDVNNNDVYIVYIRFKQKSPQWKTINVKLLWNA